MTTIVESREIQFERGSCDDSPMGCILCRSQTERVIGFRRVLGEEAWIRFYLCDPCLGALRAVVLRGEAKIGISWHTGRGQMTYAAVNGSTKKPRCTFCRLDFTSHGLLIHAQKAAAWDAIPLCPRCFEAFITWVRDCGADPGLFPVVPVLPGVEA
jgi:hypothetical protein